MLMVGIVKDTQKMRRDAVVKPTIWGVTVICLAITFAVVPLVTGNLSFMFYMMLWMTMASAFNFVAGLAGYMPFGYVAFYGVGAYVTGILYKTAGLPIGLALVGAGAAGIFVALLMAPTLRLRGVYFGIVSLAMALAAKLIISILPTKITGGSMGLILSSANNPNAAYYAMFAVLMLTLVAGTWLFFSRTGTALRAIRDDQEAAEVVGVNVVGTRLKAWIAAAVFSAPAR